MRITGYLNYCQQSISSDVDACMEFPPLSWQFTPPSKPKSTQSYKIKKPAEASRSYPYDPLNNLGARLFTSLPGSVKPFSRRY